MIRPLGRSLLALSVTVVLTAASAQAQAQAQTQSPSQSQHTPIDSLMGLFRQEAQAQPLNSREIESEGLPPPGFATPNGGPPPVSGHQFGDQAPVQIAPAPAVAPAPQADAVRPPAAVGGGPSAAPPAIASTSVMALPADEQPEQGQPKELAPNLKKQLVDYTTKEPVGTIIVDTANTYLYLVLGGGKALRYGVRVGRDGFTWAGTERISRMKEWPDWFPPSEMIERQPYLPRFMAGGNGNPLGARAMYLGKTLYRIHGTNQPSTIGHYVSSGCVGMLNEDVEDLFSRVQVGTRVVVLPGKAPDSVANAGPPPPANPMAPPSSVGNAPAAPAPGNAAPGNPTNGMAGTSLPPAR
jgi:lipoprotein-anchoring transpeptidase ErfK/SrfK